MDYLGQCISGLQDVLADHLSSSQSALKVLSIEDGAIIFSSAQKLDLSAFPQFNNLYQFLYRSEKSGGKGDDKAATMDEAITQCLAASKWQTPASQGARTFRLNLSDENKLVSADKKLIGQLIARIERAGSLRYTKGQPDVEYWVFRRDDGQVWFARRLTYQRVTEKDLAPGTLRPELAYALCLLSQPQADDRIMDPCAGSGALAFARARFPFNMMFISDLESEAVKNIRQALKTTHKRLEKRGRPIIVREADARHLDKIEDNFLTVIITDPPWGLYSQVEGDLEVFYSTLLTEWYRVLEKGGRLILLMGRRELLPALLKKQSALFHCEKQLNILVSGKKTAILCLRKV